MEKGCFELKVDDSIWIYGAGTRGERCCKALEMAGYKVVGFIDKRADDIRNTCLKTIISAEEIEENLQGDEVIIICLQNGLQQEKVAFMLASKGLHQLVFLPMCEGTASQKKRYRQIYTCMLNADFSGIKEVPIFDIKKCIKDVRVIEERQNSISFWCNIEDIHVSLFKEEKENTFLAMDTQILDKYADCEIKRFVPYADLFAYLSGECQKDISAYMKLQGRRTDESREKLLEDRKQLFRIYESALRYEMEFFTDSPAECEWNTQGYFNVKDGMHRIMYLISKGYCEVPVIVSRQAFEEYRNYKNSGMDAEKVRFLTERKKEWT